MARYKVEEVYTPCDTKRERVRVLKEFECDRVDLVDIACAARAACYTSPTSPETNKNIRKIVTESADQLEDQEAEAFTIILFGNSGEWELDIEQLPD